MLSVNIMLAFFCAFLALIMLHTNWKINRYVIFLALYLFISAFVMLFYHLVAYGGPKNLFLMMNSLFRPLLLLMGPFFYFSIRGLLEENYHFRGKVFIHFIPFFLSIFTLIPYLLEPLTEKLVYVEQSLGNISFFMSSGLVSISNSMFIQIALIHSSLYLLAALLPINRTRKKLQTYLREDYGIQYKRSWWWFMSMTAVALLINILHFGLTFIFLYQKKLPSIGGLESIEWYLVLAPMLASLLPLIVLMNPGLLYAYPAMRKMNPIMRKGRFKLGDNRSFTVLESLDKTLVYDNYFTQLSQRIMEYVNSEKPYLDIDFDEKHLSKHLSVPISHIHFCVKYNYGSSCKRVLNDFRVAYFIDEFQAEPDRAESRIADLIIESGFSSAPDFNKHFKRSQKLSFDEWRTSNT